MFKKGLIPADHLNVKKIITCPKRVVFISKPFVSDLSDYSTRFGLTFCPKIQLKLVLKKYFPMR